MRIVIDLQAAQGNNRFNAIGRFALSLALAIARNATNHEIYLILNSAFPDSILNIRYAFDKLIPQAQIRVFDIPKSTIEDDPSNTWYIKAGDKIRDFFIQQLQPDMVLVPNLLKGYCEDNIVNISMAVDPKFEPKNFSSQQIADLHRHFNVNRKMILYVAEGNIENQNIEPLIQAYSLLPANLRTNYQLVINAEISDNYLTNLQQSCKKLGLAQDELVMIGCLADEDLVTLYNSASLFVFPSNQQDIGLPVLEAIACGLPVIGSNSSNISEIINNKDALFDVAASQSIAEKMEQALQNKQFRNQLQENGNKQLKKFTLDKSVKEILHALEIHKSNSTNSVTISPLNKFKGKKPRLAFVSPLPPKRTGIAFYSADLLPELLNYYDIELISDQTKISLPSSLTTLPRRSINWFSINGKSYDRIVYQFGNSPFHSHMFELLSEHPGVVVLHDFFLSSVRPYEKTLGLLPALYYSHGYHAMPRDSDTNGLVYAKKTYPCNLDIIQKAKGIIVHSEFSRILARQWYGIHTADNWNVIPLLRIPSKKFDRLTARKALGINSDTFVVCSFGFIDATKLSFRLLEAWLSSRLSKQSNCKLIFVGVNHGGEYGDQISKHISNSDCKNKIEITGWVEDKIYQHYLQSTDICVQLRNLSRGETSAAVLDCLNYGLPTIVNANGSMTDLPENVALKLPDSFTNEELISALEILWGNHTKRLKLGTAAKQLIQKVHHPRQCAKQYAQAVENTYRFANNDVHALLRSLADIPKLPTNEQQLKQLAQCVAFSMIKKIAPRQLLVDISIIIDNNLKTGIERVVTGQLLELIKSPPTNMHVEPIYLIKENGVWLYKYARQYTSELLNVSSITLPDTPVEICPGDVYYGLGCAPINVIKASKSGLFLKWRVLGIQLNFLIYDLLPILKPIFFPPGAKELYSLWLQEIVAGADRLIGISSAVTHEVYDFLEKNPPIRTQPLSLTSLPLGADIIETTTTTDIPEQDFELLKKLNQTTSFLMVGTIEPRKGYLQALSAFDKLWQEGKQIYLVIVGKEGWLDLPKNQRRTIPEMTKRLRSHPEIGKRLFWLEDISDETLQKIYASCDCLIAASEGEGFGLPLIEAARYNLPIIARDLPVFREVTQGRAYYFDGLNANSLANSISKWLELFTNREAPSSEEIKWHTWAESREQLVSILQGQKTERIWAPDTIRRKAFDEHLNFIHAARVKMVRELLPQGNQILDLGGANSPLYKMEYPHQFEKLTLIDLPEEQRHEYYKDIAIEDDCDLGQVVIRYTDMTTLEGIEDESIDFVWSGQSIEHVPLENGERMCQEALRVLKKGGIFCLDTPNRCLTKIHTQTIGGGFIHPEHFIEYYPSQLKDILKKAGFIVKRSYGICEMPETLISKEFRYEDFMFGKQVTDKVEDAYIQFHYCIKL